MFAGQTYSLLEKLIDASAARRISAIRARPIGDINAYRANQDRDQGALDGFQEISGLKNVVTELLEELKEEAKSKDAEETLR
jgi:hypothetical protein